MHIVDDTQQQNAPSVKYCINGVAGISLQKLTANEYWLGLNAARPKVSPIPSLASTRRTCFVPGHAEILEQTDKVSRFSHSCKLCAGNRCPRRGRFATMSKTWSFCKTMNLALRGLAEHPLSRGHASRCETCPDLHSVLLPHAFLTFSELFQHPISLWEESIRGPPGAAREFRQRLQHWAEASSLAKSALGQDSSVGLAWRGRSFHEAGQCILHFLEGTASNKGFGRGWLFIVIRNLWEEFGWSMNETLSVILPAPDWSGNELSCEGAMWLRGGVEA